MIRILLDFYILVVIVDTILSYLPQYRNTNWGLKIHRVAEWSLRPIRTILPNDLPFDFSPVVLIVGLQLLKILW